MRRMVVLFIAAVFALSGCVDISDRKAPEKPVTAPVTSVYDIPDKPATVSIETTAAPETKTSGKPPSTVEIEEIYSDFEFSEEDYDFLGGCVFVGDSICSGLAHYGIIPAERVIAQGNIAARNIFDFTFTVDGGELSLLSALVNANPEYVVFSMGINDVNITTQQEFLDNYREILTMTEGFLPNAKLIFLSITPIDSSSGFTDNKNIDSFNAELSTIEDENDRWTYIDVTGELKNSENALKTAYSSGDGIHLSPDAYYAVLYQLCRGYLDSAEAENGDNAVQPPDEIIIVE